MNRDVLKIADIKQTPGRPPIWQYDFMNENGGELYIRFRAVDAEDALRFLDDLKDALREKPEIALDADTHNR